jgi:cystathionine beta-lyase
VTWPFDVPVTELRRRRGSRWTTLPVDVLPMAVAEMDARLPPSVATALRTAIEASDTGYPGSDAGVRAAFAGLAGRRWSWPVDPADIAACGDIATAATEVLRATLAPGDRVVVMPPVYPRFYAWVRAAGCIVDEVPLRTPEDGGRIDLEAVGLALAAGAKAVLLCHPHNPTGRIHPPAELADLAELAARHEALVISDEVHGLLALPAEVFTPYLAVSAAAREHGVALTSAGKAWGIAGLKCALVVAQGGRSRMLLDALRPEMAYGLGDLGLIAAEAAFGDEAWLDLVTPAIATNLDLLQSLLAEQLPAVTWARPGAGYLTWLDFRATAAADDPAGFALERARVALSPGRTFGTGNEGFGRLNVGCHEDLLRDAISRLAAALA